MRNKRLQTFIYLLVDIISSLAAWVIYYVFYVKQSGFELFPGLHDHPELIRGAALFPFFWIFLYYFWGFYSNTTRRSRLKELGASLTVTLFGTLILFTFLIYADVVAGISRSFYNSYLAFFLIQFLFSYFPRVTITSMTISAIRKGRLGFNTIILGSDNKAVSIYKDIQEQIRPTGNQFVGFVNINGNNTYPLEEYMPHLGGLDKLGEIISNYAVEEVIIALEPSENGKIEKIINMLDDRDVEIKAIPGMQDILTGRVRINTIVATPLIQVSHNLMPSWQYNLKQGLDIIISLAALILLLPVSLAIAIWIKFDSRGSVIYSHERIGRNGKPFTIYKFRTMIENAEQNGPELSSENDARVTRPGRFLRKTRLDEIPNFINVLKGEMSIVGPRPERQYYIDQIVKNAPHYRLLLRVKPGITSWGQVKYGYAVNVQQMLQRLKYDMIYLENMSIFVDFQILILTVLTIFKQKGV